MPLDDLGPGDSALAGGKAFNLGIIKKEIGCPIPRGFVISTHAFNHFIETNRLREFIDDRLAALDINDTASLNTTSREITARLIGATVPVNMAEEFQAVFSTCFDAGLKPRLAMRSSAVVTDRGSVAGHFSSVAREEARRCLRCDVCRRCGDCITVCRDKMKIDALQMDDYDAAVTRLTLPTT